MASKPYNGHRSWNAWNVALWIGNDEGLYRMALECKRQSKSIVFAAAKFMHRVGTSKTPDGAKYNITCVIEALSGLE